ncbi:MAG TPA: serine protease, partial [Lachnospiraceae bacterium]|nr:serine protease [Lachnospiraceae bacterium]
YYDIQYSLIATDMQMNSSGGRGFLMNTSGEIIGVITKKTTPSDVSVYTAIGISELKNLIERLSNGEKEVYIGVKAEEITDTVSRRTDMPKGMLVKEVQNDGPAMLAGILPMDIITEIDGNPITGYASYRAWLRNAGAGETVKVKALRSGKEGYEEAVFEVTVGER